MEGELKFMKRESYLEFKGIWPKIYPNVYVAPGAYIIGDVEIAEGSSIWFNTVVRGDVAPIRIGANTNIQDGSVVHGATGISVEIGSRITVGHNAILHGCRIEDNAFIGMGATVLTGAVVGNGAVVAAGALVPEGKVIPPNTLVMGSPARVVRELTPEDAKRFATTWVEYRDISAVYQVARTDK